MQFQKKQENCFKISKVEQNDSDNISGPGEHCPQALLEGVKLFSLAACNAMWSPPSMASGPCCVWIEFQIPLVPVVTPC